MASSGIEGAEFTAQWIKLVFKEEVEVPGVARCLAVLSWIITDIAT